jgi:hypothetical protein
MSNMTRIETLNNGELFRTVTRAKHTVTLERGLTMTPQEWAEVPDNPVQRDTEARAKRAKDTYLKKLSADHTVVQMAVLPDGRRFKLNGHTRSYLWETGAVPAPKILHVDVYHCDTINDVVELYSHFDSRFAVDTSSDQVVGAARLAGLDFKSPLLRSARYGSAVKHLYTQAYQVWGQSHSDLNFVCEAINAYAEELRLLDTINPTSAQFKAGIIMAALATLKHDGAVALGFWERFQNNKGRKDGVRQDAVQALDEVISGKKMTHDHRSNKALMQFNRGVTAYQAFRKGDTYLVGSHGGVRLMREENLLAYIRAHIKSE